MSDDVPNTKAMRPNDMCTASYYDDVKKLKELLTVPEVEDEPPLAVDFDPAEQPNPDDHEAIVEEAEVGDEEKAEAKEREEQRNKNDETIKKLVSHTDVLTTRLSPVNVSRYGLHVYIEEKDFVCNSRFRTSKKSTVAATPLHWAVLGRSHGAADFLISKGADIDALCPVLNVSSVDIAVANQSYETLRIMYEAREAYLERKRAKDEAKELRAKTIEERAEAVRAHYKRLAEEERLAAEREEGAEEEVEEAGEYYGNEHEGSGGGDEEDIDE